MPSLANPPTSKRGQIANYLTSLTISEIIDNTLTGFLVDLIQNKGKTMTLEEILGYTLSRYDTLRKPSGKVYNPQSIRKSVVCALTANGVFCKES